MVAHVLVGRQTCGRPRASAACCACIACPLADVVLLQPRSGRQLLFKGCASDDQGRYTREVMHDALRGWEGVGCALLRTLGHDAMVDEAATVSMFSSERAQSSPCDRSGDRDQCASDFISNKLSLAYLEMLSARQNRAHQHSPRGANNKRARKSSSSPTQGARCRIIPTLSNNCANEGTPAHGMHNNMQSIQHTSDHAFKH